MAQQQKEEMPTGPSPEMLHIERRIKVIEESVDNLRRKILINEQNDLTAKRKINESIKGLQNELVETKKSLDT